MKLGRFADSCLDFLTQGREMEPINSNSAAGDGPHSTRAHRGQGSVLLERSEWGGAEQALLESLGWEPGREIALDELRYIAH